MNSRLIRLIIAGVLILLFLIIFLQNTQVVMFRILFWNISASMILMFVSTLVVGFIGGFVASEIIRKKGDKK